MAGPADWGGFTWAGQIWGGGVPRSMLLERRRANIVWLVVIELLGPSSIILDFSDRNIEYNDVFYHNYIKEITGIQALSERSGSAPLNASISITFRNQAWRAFSHLVEAGETDPFQGAAVTIKELLLDDAGAPSGLLTIFAGNLDEPRNINRATFTCTASSRDYHLDRLFNLPVVDEDTFADAFEDLGKVMPVVYGPNVTLPALRVDWGARSTLKTTITDTATSLEVSDASRFPSSGSVLLNAEEMSYTGKTGDTLTGITRAQGGTSATRHGAGSVVWEKQSQYDSVIAGHELKQVNVIYAEVGGKLYRVGAPDVTAVVVAGRHLIRAADQIRLGAVEEDVDVDTGDHLHGSESEVTQPSTTSFPQIATVHNSLGTSRTQLYPAFTGTRIRITYRLNITLDMYDCGGNPYPAAKIGVIGRTNGAVKVSIKPVPGSSSSFDIQFTVSDSDKSADESLASVSGEAGHGNFCNSTFSVNSAERTIYTDPESSEATGVDRTGDIVGTHTIDRFHANVDGAIDDGSGTYTSVPLALIERPDHVLKHWLVEQMGFGIDAIDTTTFNAAGASMASEIVDGYKFAFAVMDKISGRGLAMRLARESRSALRYDAGKWYLAFVPDSAPSAIADINEGELKGPGEMFIFDVAAVSSIVNYYEVRYAENYVLLEGDSPWDGTLLLDLNPSLLGEHAALANLIAVRDSVMATSVVNHWLKESSGVLLTVRFPVFWEKFDLLPGDTISISGSLYDGKVFWIQSIVKIDRFSAMVTAKEWWT